MQQALLRAGLPHRLPAGGGVPAVAQAPRRFRHGVQTMTYDHMRTDLQPLPAELASGERHHLFTSLGWPNEGGSKRPTFPGPDPSGAQCCSPSPLAASGRRRLCSPAVPPQQGCTAGHGATVCTPRVGGRIGSVTCPKATVLLLTGQRGICDAQTCWAARDCSPEANIDKVAGTSATGSTLPGLVASCRTENLPPARAGRAFCRHLLDQQHAPVCHAWRTKGTIAAQLQRAGGGAARAGPGAWAITHP